MKRLKVDFENWGQEAVSEAVSVLRRGGVVIYPTETCYGIGVDIFNQDALQKLYMLKKMPSFKPVSVIVVSIEDAKKWSVLDEKAEDLMRRYWPGPYTFLVKRANTLPHFFNQASPKIGLRNPNVKDLIDIVTRTGHPVTTTSANISGRPECYKVVDFLNQLKGEHMSVDIDLIIDAGEIGENPPSTIYDCVSDLVIRGELEI